MHGKYSTYTNHKCRCDECCMANLIYKRSIPKKRNPENDRKYAVWYGMIDRCYNPSNPNYSNYGARGIKVCDRWLDKALFWEDMKDGYSTTLSLERVDNNGDYELSNCRWATKREQALNRRSNRLITYKGITKHLSVWSEITGIKRTTISERLKKVGLLSNL